MLSDDPRAGEPYAQFDPTTWSVLAGRLRSGQHVGARELADAIEANGIGAMPVDVQAHVVKALRGEVTEKRGRPSGGSAVVLRDTLVRLLYGRYLAWLQRRKKSIGLRGCPALRKAEWWSGSPAERAAHMTVRCLRRYRFPACDWKHVRNIAASDKRRRI
jgi:hypothetical protein